jgi:hypothetical protein
MTASSIPFSTLRLVMWHAFAGTRGLRPPWVRPNHLAAPWRQRDGAPRGSCLRPWAKVLGSQTDLLTPCYDGRAEIIPSRCLPVLLGGKGTSHVGWDTGDLTSQGKKIRLSNPTRPRFPPRRSPCGASVPLTPSGWHALRAGAWHRRRRVVAPVAPEPN